MADVIEFSSKGRGGVGASIDPDERLRTSGLTDQQTGRLKRDVAISTRGQAAASLRVHGASYEEIAIALEYATAADARKAVENVLAATADEGSDYMALRALEHLRLEGMWRSVAERAMDSNDPDQLSFHRAGLSVLDRIAKLHGLDAPQRLEFVNPSALEFEQVLGAMREMSGKNTPEPDIFELEAIDADWEEGDRDEPETEP